MHRVLPIDPGDIRAELPHAEVAEVVRRTLADQFQEIDVRAAHEAYLELAEHSESYSQYGLGAVAFFVFSQGARELRKIEGNEAKRRAITPMLNELLSDPHLLRFLKKEYGVPDPIADGRLRFHRLGTTSFILRAKPKGVDEDRILKLIQFPFVTTKTVATATEAYRERFDDLPFAPKVFGSTDRWILMEYVEGMTLQEYLEVYHSHHEASHAIAREVCRGLCSRLFELARLQIAHGDLHPENVILRGATSMDVSPGEIDVVLIDFGVNYILREKVESVDRVTEAAVYVAPEVLRDPESASSISDLYSLGVIAVQLLADVPRVAQRDLTDYLDQIRLENPALAAILDEILEAQPRLRVFDLQEEYCRGDSNPEELFSAMSRELTLELKLWEQRATKSDWDGLLTWALDLADLVSLDGKSILKRRFAEAEVLRAESSGETRWNLHFRIPTLRLYKWVLVSILSHFAVLIMLAVLILRKPLSEWDSQAIAAVVTCTSFSFVAVKYYQTVFSTFYPKDLGALGWWANAVMRFCTLYWPLPIGVVFFVDHRLWPLACVWGTGVVVANNYLSYRLGKRAMGETERVFGSSIPAKVVEGLGSFQRWWQLMAWYSLGILLVGVLLHYGVLQDLVAYVLMIVLVNVKLWIYNCDREAPSVRNTLNFLFYRMRRARRYEAVQSGVTRLPLRLDSV